MLHCTQCTTLTHEYAHSPSPERNRSDDDDDDEANEQFPLPKRLRTEAEAPKSTGPVHFQEVLGTGEAVQLIYCGLLSVSQKIVSNLLM